MVLIFGAGTLLGGGLGGSQENSSPVSAGGEEEGDRGNDAAKALAPKVTIAGQEYSTAELELDLSGMGLTDADLVNLGQMEKPGESEICWVTARFSDLTLLASLTKLESLTLPSPSAIQDLSPLSGLDQF